MRRYFILMLLVPLLLGAAGCDVINEPDNPVPGSGPCAGNGSGARRVLIEDLTGFRCPNCPQAAEEARKIQSLYCKDVVIVSLHVTSTFAAPTVAPYTTDFRTPAGNAYMTVPGLTPTGLPSGLISRRVFGNSRTLGRTSWGSATAAIIGEPAGFEVLIDTIIHNRITGAYDFRVRIPVLQPISGDHNLTIYLTEDHVMDAQMDNRYNPPDIFPFDHRHVLRDNVNGTWGDPVVTGSAAVGDTIKRTFSYPLPANVLNPANCALVAFVYRTDNYEVMQVSERKLNE
ncbi:MAG: Omp28-related outer membrane protein [Flavobacteriales bacterium]